MLPLCVTFRRVAVSLRGPGQSPVLPLRMLCRATAFCRPLRPVLLLASFLRSRSPVVGVLGLCWMWRDVPFARQSPLPPGPQNRRTPSTTGPVRPYLEPPQRRPSSRIMRRAILNASESFVTTQWSTRPRSRTLGMKSYPIPYDRLGKHKPGRCRRQDHACRPSSFGAAG